MGQKGAKRTAEAAAEAGRLVEELSELGDVTSRAMFGGFGIYESGVMFALVEPDGTPCLRFDGEPDRDYLEAGSRKHERMPYWSIPPAIRSDEDALLEWATSALDIATAAKRGARR